MSEEQSSTMSVSRGLCRSSMVLRSIGPSAFGNRQQHQQKPKPGQTAFHQTSRFSISM